MLVTAASFVVVESRKGKDVNQETHRVRKFGKRLEEVTEECGSFFLRKQARLEYE